MENNGPQGRERRRHKRFRASITGSIHYTKHFVFLDELKCEVVDISKGGVKLSATQKHNFRKNKKYDLNLKIFGKIVKFKIAVLDCYGDGYQGYSYSCQFYELSADAESVINELLRYFESLVETTV